MFRIIFITILFFYSTSANSYIGPGMGGGVIMATLGIVIAIFIGIFSILWFPIKRLLSRKKNKFQDPKKGIDKNLDDK